MRSHRTTTHFAVALALVAATAGATTQVGTRKPGVRVVHSDVSPPLRSIPIVPPAKEPSFSLIADPGEIPTGRPGYDVTDIPDPLVQDWTTMLGMPAPLISFDGPSNVCGGCSPPDPNGAIGPNHFITMQNSSYAIYDRTGALLFGPAANNTLWAGFGGPCQTENAGDPVVLHDQLADRWVLMQFTDSSGPPFLLCVAVSATADPLGTYQRYAVDTQSFFPDYPKMSLWPDGYYFSTRELSGGSEQAGAYAIDRAAVLAGAPSPTVVGFVTTGPAYHRGDGLLPADLDGNTLPPAGSPNYFVGSMDDGGPDGAPQDALYIWELHADFATPGNSTFTLEHTIPIAAFDTIFPCTPGSRSCIPQPGTTAKIDILSYRQRPMHRAAYRNFGTHESLVTNQSVEAVAGIAGVRWWELRDLSSTPVLHQEGTYAPGATDGIHRWMGSAAMDGAGNIALGYSASDATATFPSVWYTGRLASDPLGTMPQGEGSIIDGTGSQTSTGGRWGDYTALTVDPVDDCTFWYVNQYLPTTSTTGYRLRVGAFRFDECGEPTFFLQPTPAERSICVGSQATFEIAVGSVGGFDDDVTLSSDGAPAGTTANFSPNPVAAPGTSTLTIGNTAGATPGNYVVTIDGEAPGPLTSSTEVELELLGSVPPAPGLVSPADGATGVPTATTLTWTAVAGAAAYLLEVDDDADFSSPELSTTVDATSANASGLDGSTLYHWRVTAENACGGAPSTVFTFTTGSCGGTVVIQDAATGSPYPSNLALSGLVGFVTSLSLEIYDFTHTFPDDVDLLLVAPSGETLVVAADVGGSGDVVAIDLVLDDAAPGLLPDSGPLTSGAYRPSNVVSGDAFPAPAPVLPHGNPAPAGSATFGSVFDGVDPNGTWRLFAVDDSPQDSGTIGGWCLVATVDTMPFLDGFDSGDSSRWSATQD